MKCEFVTLPLPIAGIDLTDSIFFFIGRHAKGREVVPTDENFARSFYHIQVEFTAHIPRIVPADGLFVIPDAIKIMAALGIETRVKIKADIIGPFDGNIGWQHAIERVLQAIKRNIARGREIDDLPECVNARIGATRRRNRDRCAIKLLKACLKFALHRALVGLNLPALKVGSIVFERQANLHDNGPNAIKRTIQTSTKSIQLKLSFEQFCKYTISHGESQ